MFRIVGLSSPADNAPLNDGHYKPINNISSCWLAFPDVVTSMDGRTQGDLLQTTDFDRTATARRWEKGVGEGTVYSRL